VICAHAPGLLHGYGRLKQATAKMHDLRAHRSVRRPGCRVVFYDSERHQQTGNISDLLAGNAPILVERDTSETHPTGTVWPVGDYIHECTERKTAQHLIDACHCHVRCLRRVGVSLVRFPARPSRSA